MHCVSAGLRVEGVPVALCSGRISGRKWGLNGRIMGGCGCLRGQYGQIQGCGEHNLCRWATHEKYNGRERLPAQVSSRKEGPCIHFQVLWHLLAITGCETLGKLLKFPVLECPTCKMEK